MKELIVVIGMTLLGCLIFNLIAGDKASLKSVSIEYMDKMVKMYEEM